MDSSTESLASLNLAAEMEKPLPLDLSHLYSETTKRRLPSKMKEYYKFFQIPGVRNLAGGMFFPSLFVRIRDEYQGLLDDKGGI